MSDRKRAVSADFARAAATYDAAAPLQRYAASILAARIGVLSLPPAPCVFEFGCGTGLLTGQLRQALPGAHGVITDLAPAMVERCRVRHAAPGAWHFAVMDAEAPAIAAASIDLACGSLVVQWFDDLARALDALHGVLRPGGWLAFTSLGPASLAEWRDAYAAEGLPAPTPAFASAAQIASAWPGFAQIESFPYAVRHGSGRAFLAGLRAIGATTPRAGHQPTRPGRFHDVLRRFEQNDAATARYDVMCVCLRRG